MNANRIKFTDFPDYAALVQALEELRLTAPNLMSIASIGKSREGRDLLLVTLADFASSLPEERPAIYLQGDIHPLEFGRIHLYYIIRNLIQQHETDGILSRRTFYIIPSVNPDGAEKVVKQGVPFIRSSLPLKKNLPDTLYPSDVDGDGRILWMRQETPDGDQMEDPLEPRLMIPRVPGAKGPFYKVFMEGIIENWSGTSDFQQAPPVNWNCSYPTGWEPGPVFGDFMPMNQPELQLTSEFIFDHPNICGAFSVHVGGASLVLPPNRVKLEPMDAAYYAGVGRDYTKITHLEARASVDTHVPPWYWWVPSGDRPGTFVDYIHYTFGIPGFDLETDGLLEKINFHLKDIDNLQNWNEYNAMNRKMLAFYDTLKDAPPVFVPWKKTKHPQLGDVELGGLLSHVTYIRPLPEIPEECNRLTAFISRFASQTPQAAISDISITPLQESGLYRLTARAFNTGERPTCLTRRGASVPGRPVPRMDFIPADGVTAVDGVYGKKIGHLEGFSGSAAQEWILHLPRGTTQVGRLLFDAGTGGRASRIIEI